MKILIVGSLGGTNVGGSFERAAELLSVPSRFVETQAAYGKGFYQRAVWRLFGNQPQKLDEFGLNVTAVCDEFKPDLVLTTGVSPLGRRHLSDIKKKSIRVINFLTDDPWSKNHACRWFMEALPEYDVVFNPRKANMGDLTRLGCPMVQYLPFAYDPALWFKTGLSDSEAREYDADILFVGGADAQRVPYIKALANEGFKVRLYGSYWDRFRGSRAIPSGQTTPDVVRKATIGSKISLCLVHRSNRDGHVMRSFEIAAMGACMLAEDTQEHRDLFGESGDKVVFFGSKEDMIQKARYLLASRDERVRLGNALFEFISRSNHGYVDRLRSILGAVQNL